MIELNQEDAVFVITVNVKDITPVEAVDLTQFVAYGCILSIDEKLMQKYSSQPQEGWKEAIEVDPTNGVFKINVFREDQIAAKQGMVNCKIIAFKTDTDFNENKFFVVSLPLDLFYSKKYKDIDYGL